MHEALAVSLVLLGATSIVAALAGGLHFGDVEFPALRSSVLRSILAVVGVIFLLVGFGTLAAPTVSEAGGETEGNDRGVSRAEPDTPPARSSTVPRRQPPFSPGTSDDRTSAVAAYRKTADGYCVMAQRQFPVPEDQSREAFISAGLEGGRVLSDLAADLRSMDVPNSVATRHAALVTAIDQSGDLITHAMIALRSGDEIGYIQYGDQLKGSRAEARQNAKSLSLPHCALG